MCRTRSETPPHEPPMVHVAVEKPTLSSSKSSIAIKHKKHCFIWAGVIVASVFITCTMIVVALGLHYEQKQQKTNESNTILFKDDNEALRFISKQKWKALATNGEIPELYQPVKYVIICHTAGRFCVNFKMCSAVVKYIQNRCIQDLQMPDIMYNFIVGGDGNIYEGRGWNKQNNLMNNSVSFGFIGNYVFDIVTEEIIESTKKFLARGVEDGKLDENYFLVPHNQTKNTQSPGPNAVREIRKWSHYTSDFIVD